MQLLPIVLTIVPTTRVEKATRAGDRPVLQALRIEQPPTIDGDLSETDWQRAQRIAGLTEVEPHEGAQPSENTQVAVLYTRDALYIGAWCFDRDPAHIIATEMRRDVDLDANDRLQILLDTFLDRRNAFLFVVAPAGARLDALIANNGAAINEQWDAVWRGKTAVTDAGWSVEIEIPFESISFDENRDTWGFNVQRVIKRRQEFDRWSGAVLDASFSQPARAGDLIGLHDLRQGLGIDVRPFGTLHYRNDRVADEREVSPDAGGDVFWRVTPSFTAILTVNTDFAETEVDTRQTNLTRFPLFFPEKRDFFLEDAEIFSFADAGDDTSLIPFFSRRIGLASGEEVPIRWGVKGVGRAGDYNIGVLDVETGRFDGIDERNLFAARVSRNVFDTSEVGFIATRGNPLEPGQNGVIGVDYDYRTTDLFGDKNLRGSVYGLRSFTTDDRGDDKAYGFRLAYPNDVWSSGLAYQVIEDRFNPALGFVPRTGVKTYAGELHYEPRLDTWIRQLRFGIEPKLLTDSGNRLDSWQAPITFFGFELDDGDELELRLVPQFERLETPFEIETGIIVPPGDYDELRGEVFLSTALKRPVSIDVNYSTGTFLDGHLDQYGAEVTWRANRHLATTVGYEQNDVNLDQGDFVTRLALARLNLSFTPELSWSSLVQYDTESRLLGLNSRVRFIVEDGRELFLVYNHGWLREAGGSSFDTQTEVAILKLAYSMRF
ncbi:MAG: DUF5916 domain-containing protein [Planctomycetota bacterium]